LQKNKYEYCSVGIFAHEQLLAIDIAIITVFKSWAVPKAYILINAHATKDKNDTDSRTMCTREP